MDKNLHLKHVPTCKKNIFLGDAYLWPDKDTNKYMCTNGISHPIYDCKGWVNFSLPLELYPPVNEVHPQIEMARRMHLNWRKDPTKLVELGRYTDHHPREEFQFDDLESGRVEGFYSTPRGGNMRIHSDKVPGYPLPSPYGHNRGNRSCGSYS